MTVSLATRICVGLLSLLALWAHDDLVSQAYAILVRGEPYHTLPLPAFGSFFALLFLAALQGSFALLQITVRIVMPRQSA